MPEPAAPARHLDYIALDLIEPAEVNPKDHAEALIGASVGRFGYIEPAVIDERTGRLVGGHGRTDELRRRRDAGLPAPEGVTVAADGTWMVPLVRGWRSTSDDEAVAAGIALNRIGERGGWHVEELYAELDRLAQGDQGLEGVGFDSAELDDLLASMQEHAVEYDPALQFGGPATGEPSLTEKAERYAGKGVRSMILDFRVDEFDELAATCARLRRHLGIDTNAELVLRLVRDEARQLPTSDEARQLPTSDDAAA